MMSHDKPAGLWGRYAIGAAANARPLVSNVRRGTLGAPTVLKKSVEKRDFHGLLGAHNSKLIRAFRGGQAGVWGRPSLYPIFPLARTSSRRKTLLKS